MKIQVTVGDDGLLHYGERGVARRLRPDEAPPKIDDCLDMLYTEQKNWLEEFYRRAGGAYAPCPMCNNPDPCEVCGGRRWIILLTKADGSSTKDSLRYMEGLGPD